MRTPSDTDRSGQGTGASRTTLLEAPARGGRAPSLQRCGVRVRCPRHLDRCRFAERASGARARCRTSFRVASERKRQARGGGQRRTRAKGRGVRSSQKCGGRPCPPRSVAGGPKARDSGGERAPSDCRQRPRRATSRQAAAKPRDGARERRARSALAQNLRVQNQIQLLTRPGRTKSARPPERRAFGPPFTRRSLRADFIHGLRAAWPAATIDGPPPPEAGRARRGGTLVWTGVPEAARPAPSSNPNRRPMEPHGAATLRGPRPRRGWGIRGGEHR